MGKSLAGRGGFEPPLADPESAVLPLDDLPKTVMQNIFYHSRLEMSMIFRGDIDA